MPKGKPHNADKRAAVIASLLTGDSVSEVAEKHGLNKSVVSRWKGKIPVDELQRLATKKGDYDDDAVFDCVTSNLRSLMEQAETVRNPEYLRKQGWQGEAAGLETTLIHIKDKEAQVTRIREISNHQNALS